MKIKQFIFLILVHFGMLITWVSCQTLVNVAIPDAKSVSLDSIRIERDIYVPMKMIVVGNKVVVYERKDESMFSVFALPDFNYLYSFGEKGHGPNELLTIDNSFAVSDDGFRLFEIETNMVKRAVIADTSAHIMKDRRLKTSRLGLNRIGYLSDNAFVYLSDDETHEYCRLSDEGQETYFGEYPEGLLAEDRGMPKMFTYNKHVAGKPDGSRFAAFYAYMRLCRVYDKEMKLLHDTLVEVPESKDAVNVVVYPEPPFVTDDYLYIIHTADDRCELEVWDWNGQLTALYQLDKPIKTVAVSGNVLYGFSADAPNLVYKYLFP